MKKYLFLFLILLSFLGIGYSISNVQSTKAEYTLNTNGMSKRTRQIADVKQNKVSDLVRYLNKKFPKSKIKLQLIDRKNQNKVLMWSNFNLKSLPTDDGKGRYFGKPDFKGQVTFAIINTASPVDLMQVQGHSYLKDKDQYIAVIGTLKSNSMSDKRYYLTTGLNQETGTNLLKDYHIELDGLASSQLKKVAKKFNGTVKPVSNISKTNLAEKKPIAQFIFVVSLILFTLVINVLQAIRTTKLSIQSKVHGNLLERLLTNQIIRDRGANITLALLALLIANYLFFFTNYADFALIIGLTWFLGTLTFVITVIFVKRKD